MPESLPLPDSSAPASARVVAIIPARGGSKGIPGKNLRPVGAVPLVVRAIHAAQASIQIDHVVVSTDDRTIAAVSRAAGAVIALRPADLAGDTASSESALLHAIGTLDAVPEVIVFLQATSPFIDGEALNRAVALVLADVADVAFSVVPVHEFLWRDGSGGATGINHDWRNRPMRQQREPQYRETGAFYVMRTSGLLEGGYRFFGRVQMVEVDPMTAIEIDTTAELELADRMAEHVEVHPDLRESIDVDAVVTDFDGVHTDDFVLIGADGSEYVTASRADGHGVALLRRAGIPLMILSTETNPVVAARAAKLHVEVRHGIDDKATALVEWSETHSLALDRIAYLGNDVNDLPAMGIVGWPIAVSNAHPAVRKAARLVLDHPGGAGAVRELADLVVATKDHHQKHDRAGEK